MHLLLSVQTPRKLLCAQGGWCIQKKQPNALFDMQRLMEVPGFINGEREKFKTAIMFSCQIPCAPLSPILAVFLMLLVII